MGDVKREIERQLGSAEPNHTLVRLFAGHGGPEVSSAEFTELAGDVLEDGFLLRLFR